jgi:hypothetical protein
MSEKLGRLAKVHLVLLGALAASGCSSIIEGRSQQIVINTNPSGATCSLIRNDMPIGTVTPTPNGILIEKTKHDIIVKCNKEGYQEATYFNKSGSAGATFGNIVLGGGIGWAIDSASGADNKYDSPLNITMVPILPGVASVSPTTNTVVPVAAAMPANTMAAPSRAPTAENKPESITVVQTTEKPEEPDFPTGKRN